MREISVLLAGLAAVIGWRIAFGESSFSSVAGWAFVFASELVVWSTWPIRGGGGVLNSVLNKHQSHHDE